MARKLMLALGLEHRPELIVMDERFLQALVKSYREILTVDSDSVGG